MTDIANATEAIAEAWASIDGKLEAFVREKSGAVKSDDPTFGGHYDGYMTEAEELIERVRKRGFEVVPAKAGVHVFAKIP